MTKVSKNICSEIIGSHHTLKIIAMCKTIVTTKPIYKTICVVYPLSPCFKNFSLSNSLSEVETNSKKREIMKE